MEKNLVPPGDLAGVQRTKEAQAEAGVSGERCDFCDASATHFDRNLVGLCDECFAGIQETQPESGLWN